MTTDKTMIDRIDGCTGGRPWNWQEALVAEMAVSSFRDREAKEREETIREVEIRLAVCSAVRIGFVEFTERYFRLLWELWRYNLDLGDVEDELQEMLTRKQGPAG